MNLNSAPKSKFEDQNSKSKAKKAPFRSPKMLESTVKNDQNQIASKYWNGSKKILLQSNLNH